MDSLSCPCASAAPSTRSHAPTPESRPHPGSLSASRTHPHNSHIASSVKLSLIHHELTFTQFRVKAGVCSDGSGKHAA